MGAATIRENENRFVEWLADRSSTEQMAEVYLAVHELENYAAKEKIIEDSIFETIDVAIYEKLWVSIDVDDEFKRASQNQLQGYSDALDKLIEYACDLTGKQRTIAGNLSMPVQAGDSLMKEQELEATVEPSALTTVSRERGRNLKPELEKLLEGVHLEPVRIALDRDSILSVEQFLELNLLDYMNERKLYPATRCRAIVSSLRVKMERARTNLKKHNSALIASAQEKEPKAEDQILKVAKTEENDFVLKTPVGTFSENSPSLAFAAFCEAVASEYRGKLRSITGVRPYGFDRVPLYVVREANDIKVNHANIYVASDLTRDEVIRFTKWICTKCNIDDASVEWQGEDKHQELQTAGLETTIVNNAPFSDEKEDGEKNLAASAPQEHEAIKTSEKKLYTIRTTSTAYSGETAAEACAAFCNSLAVKYRNKLRMLTGIRVPNTNHNALYLGKTRNGISIPNAGLYVAYNLTGEEALRCAQWLCECCKDPDMPQEIIEPSGKEEPSDNNSNSDIRLERVNDFPKMEPERQDLSSTPDFQPLSAPAVATNMMVKPLYESTKEAEISTAITEPESYRETAPENCDTIDFNNITSVFFMRPVGFQYRGKYRNTDNWKDLFCEICELLCQDYPYAFYLLRQASMRQQDGRWLVDEKSLASLIEPRKIAENYYVETKRASTALLNILKQAMDECGIDYNTLVIYYGVNRKKEESESKKPVFSTKNEYQQQAATENTRQEVKPAQINVAEYPVHSAHKIEDKPNGTDAKKAPVEEKQSQDTLYKLTVDGETYQGSSSAEAFLLFCESMGYLYPRAMQRCTLSRPKNVERAPFIRYRAKNALKVESINAYIEPTLTEQEVCILTAWICESCGITEATIALKAPEGAEIDNPERQDYRRKESVLPELNEPVADIQDSSRETTRSMQTGKQIERKPDYAWNPERREFERWLQNTNCPTGSIRAYCDALTRIGAYLNQKSLEDRNIFSIRGLTRLETIRNELRNSTDYLNKFPGVVLSADLFALKKYIDFRRQAEETGIDEEVKAKYSEILREHFENGFRSKSIIDINRFKTYYAEHFQTPLSEPDEELVNIVKAIGEVQDGRVFYRDKKSGTDLLDDIQAEMMKAFRSGASAIYVSSLFERYKSELANQLQIFDPQILREQLSKISSGEYYYVNGYFYQLGRKASLSNEIQRAIERSGLPVSLTDLQKQIWYAPAEVIKKAAVSSQIVTVERDTYYYVPNFPVNTAELQQIRKLIDKELGQKEYVPYDRLKQLISDELPSVAINTDDFSARGIGAILSVLLQGSFNFNRANISSKGLRTSAAQRFAEYCRTHNSCNMDELKEYAASINTTFNLEIIYEEMIRVSETEFINKNQIHFNVKDTDRAIEELMEGDYMPLKGFSYLFLHFPVTDFKWNTYVLESYAAHSSQKFRLIHSGYAQGGAFGCVIRKHSEIEDIDDLVVDVLERDDTWTTAYDALDLMLYEGYLGRSTRNFNALVQEAERKREKRIAGK